MPRHPGLFLSPLDGFGSAVPSFLLHLVFGAVSNGSVEKVGVEPDPKRAGPASWNLEHA